MEQAARLGISLRKNANRHCLWICHSDAEADSVSKVSAQAYSLVASLTAHLWRNILTLLTLAGWFVNQTDVDAVDHNISTIEIYRSRYFYIFSNLDTIIHGMNLVIEKTES